jgi:cathepsin H
MVNISEQQLVDCAGAFNNNGCDGGLPSQAYEYIHSAGGIDSESAYPYTAKTGAECLFKQAAVVAKVSDVVNITQFDEDELRDAVGSVGPVSIAFEVADDFRFYKGGVYDGVCRTGLDTVNHAVVAVGYGATSDGQQYWTVRNSWSAGWGEAGYFRIARGVNKCGLADCASFPIVA